MEFGPAELATPLVVVLGHQCCGAVTAAEAAIREDEHLPGRLQHIAEALRPAYEEAAEHGGPDRVDRMIRINTRDTVAALRGNPLLAPRVEEHSLDIIGGYYSLETGRVTLD
ncbi:hypothetical protein GCM10027570_45480 [Streptomonospora sediminis]